jgi:Starch-binding associating with outer membrane
MRNKRILTKTLLLLLVVLFLGCNSFLDVNDTPNNPTVVPPPAVLLATGLAGSAFANGNELNRFASTIMDYNYGSGGSPGGWDIYNTNGSDFGNQWRFEIYGGALTTYEQLILSAEKLGSKSYVGIAKIMKAYTFCIATDVWGDVPYSQAAKGEQFLQPRIDKQEDIYKGNASLGIQSLFDLVREGLTDLAAPSFSNPSTEDIIYGGSISNWKRAGRTLMLKMALQISDREPALATSVMNEVLGTDNGASELITANAQNLSVNFGSSTGSQSPIYTWTYVSLFSTDMMTSTGYVNLLSGLNDPRLNLFITKPTGSFVTYANGTTQTLAKATDRSQWSPLLLGPNGVGPIRLLTNAQRAFILAEAKLILPGINTGTKTAQEFFQEGIKAHMDEFKVDATARDNYVTLNGTLTGTTAQQIAQIITQKYIASTCNGLEAWNDYRRTGYPNFPEHANAVGIDGRRPKRCAYINQEVQRNPNFTPIVQPNVKVWWDIN